MKTGVKSGHISGHQTWKMQQKPIIFPTTHRNIIETIYKAYVREYPPNIWPYMVQYLHFRILKFPLNRLLSKNLSDGMFVPGFFGIVTVLSLRIRSRGSMVNHG